MSGPSLTVEPCSSCQCPRTWWASISSRRDDELEPELVKHLYRCFCASVSVLVVFADGRREWRQPPRRAWEFLS